MKSTSLFLAIFFAAISFSTSAQDFGVIRGNEIEENLLKSVFKLPNGCTATMVSNKVFITSAHCVSRKTIRVFGQTARLVTHPKYDLRFFRSKEYAKFYDLAVGILSKARRGVEPASFCEVGNSSSLVGDRALLVGYGCNEWPSRSGTGTKRYGYTTVSKIDSVFIEFMDEEGGLSCPGDSGGPYFRVNEDQSICYLATNFYSDRKTTNMAANHFDPVAREFIETTIRRNNLEICGLNKTCDEILIPETMREQN